jgi:TPR repeat protein
VFTGLCYQEGNGVIQNYNAAIAWYHKALESGEKEALISISSMFQAGLGFNKDYKTSIWYLEEYLKLNNDDGFGPIYSLIAGMYEKGGYGVEQDLKKALGYYIKADKKNCTDGACMIGMYYAKGDKCVEQNFNKAFEYYSKAAANKSGLGQFLLGNMYFEGGKISKEHYNFFRNLMKMVMKKPIFFSIEWVLLDLWRQCR